MKLFIIIVLQFVNKHLAWVIMLLRLTIHTALIFAVYGSIVLFQSVQETFAYGFGKVMVLCVCYSIGVIVKYSLVYFGTMIYPNAWIIVVLSNIFVILPFCIIQPFYLKKEIERLKN